MKKLLLILALAALIAGGANNSAYAQKKNKKSAKTEAVAKPNGDAPDAAKPAAKPKGPVSMEKFLKEKTSTMKGFTTVYRQGDKWFLNINDSIIGRDIEIVTRLSKSAEGLRSGFGGYAGDQLGEGMIRFEKGPSNKIFIRSIQLRERSTGELAQNVQNSNTTAIVAAFDIKAQSDDKKDNVIDITDFLMSDNSFLYFNKRAKKMFNVTSFSKERSYIASVKTFPINTEIKVAATYAKEEGSATFEFNASLVLLPKEPMQARYEDNRVGYFTVRYTDFDKNPQGVKTVKLAARWRLEPKEEDMQKYAAGELVEPKKPIVIYIDPSTPKEWVPYLIQGVNDWQPAFEAAGFKNAIRAEVAPTFEQDSTWSLEDALHSAIVYKPSDVSNASGPHVSDPRSGEIIETHINWYHNVMKLVRDWYLVQCAPADTLARHLEFPTELMGELVRFVSSHEVGHTLGLRHNFVGSACPIYTVENLKNVEFLKKYGHATSIMDYARFNYLAEGSDNIPRELLYPCIGPYDKWSIEWGYRYYPQFKNADEELPYLSKLVSEKVKNPIYKFGTESDPNDPRFQSEDLGCNQMESNEVGIRNLKFIMPNLEKWTLTPNEQYDNLREIYSQVIGQYQRYIGHVAKWVGGVYTDEKRSDEEGAIHTFVPKAKQKEAMAFLKKHFFTPQSWLLPQGVFDKTNTRADVTMMGLYSNVLNKLLVRRVFLSMYEAELALGSDKAYTIGEYFKDLNAMVFAPAPSNAADAAYQRMMQKTYVQILCDMYTGANIKSAVVMGRTMQMGVAEIKDNFDIGCQVQAQLEALLAKFKASSAAGSAIQKAHYKFLAKRIDNALNPPVAAAK